MSNGVQVSEDRATLLRIANHLIVYVPASIFVSVESWNIATWLIFAPFHTLSLFCLAAEISRLVSGSLVLLFFDWGNSSLLLDLSNFFGGGFFRFAYPARKHKHAHAHTYHQIRSS